MERSGSTLFCFLRCLVVSRGHPRFLEKLLKLGAWWIFATNVSIEVFFTTEAAYFGSFIPPEFFQRFTLIPNMPGMVNLRDLTKGTWVFGTRWHCCKVNPGANAGQYRRLFGGAMARWCDGSMVRWREGAMVRGCENGAMVRDWCDGATMVRWCNAAQREN